MWPRAVSGRSKRTSPYVRSCLRRARAQMAWSGASLAVLAGNRSAALGLITVTTFVGLVTPLTRLEDLLIAQHYAGGSVNI